MCESNAYLRRKEGEDLLLSSVARIDPTDSGYRLTGLFGEEVEVRGRLEEINLLGHRIVFSENE